ncbi:hypothetical protein NPX13_g2704 [Xylaria arbuscula]|uniref:Uncharacterized protein n=1 Tax=Xylaria arbuscula TaxID=114810 RepID=A0A9W8NIP5_9PEZI|nr:hypothetical protein NPX13_g2704 [Xylaria arbuscula]
MAPRNPILELLLPPPTRDVKLEQEPYGVDLDSKTTDILAGVFFGISAALLTERCEEEEVGNLTEWYLARSSIGFAVYAICAKAPDPSIPKAGEERRREGSVMPT